MFSTAVSNISIDDVADFVESNRDKCGEWAFKDWSREIIKRVCVKCLHENTFTYTVNKQGKLNGILCAERDDLNKILFVTNVLVIEPTTFYKMCFDFLEYYPDYDVQALRKGNLVRYKSTSKLIRRLINNSIKKDQ